MLAAFGHQPLHGRVFAGHFQAIKVNDQIQDQGILAGGKPLAQVRPNLEGRLRGGFIASLAVSGGEVQRTLRELFELAKLRKLQRPQSHRSGLGYGIFVSSER